MWLRCRYLGKECTLFSQLDSSNIESMFCSCARGLQASCHLTSQHPGDVHRPKSSPRPLVLSNSSELLSCSLGSDHADMQMAGVCSPRVALWDCIGSHQAMSGCYLSFGDDYTGFYCHLLISPPMGHETFQVPDTCHTDIHC